MSLDQLFHGEQDGFHPFGYALPADPFEWSDSELISWCRGQLTSEASTNKVYAELRRRYHYPANMQNSAIRTDVATKGTAVTTHGFLFLIQALDRLTNLPDKRIGHTELHAAMIRMLDMQYELFELAWTDLLARAQANPAIWNSRNLFTGTSQMSLTTTQYRIYIRLLQLVLETKAPADRYKVNRAELRSGLDSLGLVRYLKLAKFYKLL